MKRLLASVAAAIFASGCAARLPARNDPSKAKGFYCTRSDTRPEAGVCIIDDKPRCDGAVAEAAGVGAFMSPCARSTMAWCVVATFEGPPAELVFHCAPTLEACMARLEELESNRHYSDFGECVERSAGR